MFSLLKTTLLFSVAITMMSWSTLLWAQWCKEWAAEEYRTFSPKKGDWSWRYYNWQKELWPDQSHDTPNDQVLVEIFNSNELEIARVKWIGTTKNGAEKSYGWFETEKSIKAGTKGSIKFDVAPEHIKTISKAKLILSSTPTISCSIEYTAKEISALKAEEARKKEAKEAQEKEWQIIFDNCVIAKVGNNPSKPFLGIVKRECRRIADDPSFLDKLRY